MARVCPGTSVILAPVVVCWNRRSSDCDKTESAGDQGAVHEFRLPGERKRAPGNVPRSNGLLHALALWLGGLFEVLVNQPRTLVQI